MFTKIGRVPLKELIKCAAQNSPFFTHFKWSGHYNFDTSLTRVFCVICAKRIFKIG